MKKLVIILALIIANSSLFAQIAIQDFKFGSKHLTPELESFQFKVKEEMNKYFFIYQQDFDGILNEYNISTIRENFKSALIN